MGLIAAKCTSCGSNIEVDREKEAGICEHCGTAFITEKAIINYNTYVTNNNSFAGANVNIVHGDVSNMLSIASTALAAGNEEEAYSYANRILEINFSSSEAWMIKMKAIGMLSNNIDPRAKEIILCGSNVIQFSDDKESAEEQVYRYFLEKGLQLANKAVSFVNATESVRGIPKAHSSGLISETNAICEKEDRGQRSICETLANNAVACKTAVPAEKIANSQKYQIITIEIARLYIQYVQGYSARLAMYGHERTAEYVFENIKALADLKEGLSGDILDELSEEKVDKKIKEPACYIATYVYESYHCPEVWVLRRFRDDTLDSHWYGKLFIWFYYRISPHMVKYLGGQKWFKGICRKGIDKLVFMLKKKGIEDTCYFDKY